VLPLPCDGVGALGELGIVGALGALGVDGVDGEPGCWFGVGDGVDGPVGDVPGVGDGVGDGAGVLGVDGELPGAPPPGAVCAPAAVLSANNSAIEIFMIFMTVRSAASVHARMRDALRESTQAARSSRRSRAAQAARDGDRAMREMRASDRRAGADT